MQKRIWDKIIGREKGISLPNGAKHIGKYALTDLDNILASHNEINFSNTKGYPLNENGENINDRNYHDDISAQNSVIKIAQNLDPDQLISLSSGSDGTPIVDVNGYVASGNNRVMSLKLAKRKYPEKYENYINELKENIDIFKIDEDEIAKFKNPVLIRIDESLPENLTTEDLAQFNTASTKGERPLDRAVKLANILKDNTKCRNVILSIIDGYETFTDIYSPEARNDRKRLIDSFISCGLISELQLPTYYNDNQFTEIGKDFVETILSAIILTPNALKVSNEAGVKRLRQIIISSLPILITNENLKEGSLKDYISEALVLQYKINQFQDFQDYARNQSLFPEDKFSEKSFYINLLLNVGRNKFKDAIKKYNQSVKANEGDSLFATETLTIDEIFDKIFTVDIDEKNKKLIQMLNPIEKENYTENIKETPNDDFMDLGVNVSLVDLDIDDIIVEEKYNIKFIANDYWYTLHPEKVLGVAYKTTGKYGEITKYRGDISVIDRIDVLTDFIGFDKSEYDPLISIDNFINKSAEILKFEVQKDVQIALDKVDVEIETIKRVKRQKTKTVSTVTEIEESVVEIKTFSDMYAELNPNISMDELECYIYYKTKIGQPLSRNYMAIINPDLFPNGANLRLPYKYEVSNDKIDYWVKNSLLFYYKGEFLPKYEYTSGNMYDRKIYVDAEKNIIVERYGLQVYEKQLELLLEAFKRLNVLDISGENSLTILPISKFALNFFITKIKETEEKNWKIKTNNKGDLELIKDLSETSEYKKSDVKEISLTDAYKWWLVNTLPILKANTNHYNIISFYLEGKSPLRGNPDLTPKEATQIKTLAKQEGERLFKEFLETQILTNDKIRIQTEWNDKFNNYVPIDFNLLPISFTMAKYVGGVPEVIRSEKRDAIAHAMSNGTSILAYDVGVGKTPSAIFTISTFIDAGYCKRPLITVPNQVYRQFIGELKMFVPHLKINELYNLSGEYLDKLKNANGEIQLVDEYTVSILTYEGLENIGFTEETKNLLIDNLDAVLSQGGKELSEKGYVSFRENLETLVGRGDKGGRINI